MTGAQQRAALQNQIWRIANEVRGAVDGWDFKQYVLGTLSYRFISENFVDYITGGDSSVHYSDMADDDKNIAATKDDAIKTKGTLPGMSSVGRWMRSSRRLIGMRVTGMSRECCASRRWVS